MKKKTRRSLSTAVVLGLLYAALRAVARKTEESPLIDQDNPYLPPEEGKEAFSLYRDRIKPGLDRMLSFFGLLALTPVFSVLAILIHRDDPGPVFFTQKRVGKDGHFFELHKFRTMKMNTPRDMPTHLLKDPDQYITRVGRFLRRTSLDELPQVWDIFRGKMSLVGPRPALYNQEDLVAERKKAGAVSVVPGLTGWAQINGRDELEIPVKAGLDEEYADVLNRGGIAAFLFDLKCLFGTVAPVLRGSGVVEGGTGELAREGEESAPDFGHHKTFQIDRTVEKKVLITGAGSYLGESFAAYAKEHFPTLTVDTLDLRDPAWREVDFHGYDAVYHVAGIAHADVGKASEEEKARYYAVNRDLAVETAEKAKREGVRQFLFMSSMIVYGEAAPYGKTRVIREETAPAPANFYGDSKWQADKALRALADPDFHVAVLRPPMIYGKGSKGNYRTLSRLARKVPVFPAAGNERSVLYIENLCEFLGLLILSGEGGIYFPQNGDYASTERIVREVRITAGKPVTVTHLLDPGVAILSHVPGKAGDLGRKAFGNFVYDQALSVYPGLSYQKYDLRESILRAEGKE